MNNKQRLTLRIVAAVVALMVLFPPYVVRLGSAKIVREQGYGFVFSLPIYSVGQSGNFPGQIDAEKLAAQIAGALIVGALIFVSQKD